MLKFFSRQMFFSCAVASAFFSGFVQAATGDELAPSQERTVESRSREGSIGAILWDGPEQKRFESQWFGERDGDVRFICFTPTDYAAKANYSVTYNLPEVRKLLPSRDALNKRAIRPADVLSRIGLESEFLRGFVQKKGRKTVPFSRDNALENYTFKEFLSDSLDATFLKNLPALVRMGAPGMFFEVDDWSAKPSWCAPSEPILQAFIAEDQEVFWSTSTVADFRSVEASQNREEAVFFILFKGLGILRGTIKTGSVVKGGGLRYE